MGFNTTLMILNDSFGAIQRDPETFVSGILGKMADGGDISVGGHCNAATVMNTAHADVPRLYFTKANDIVELSEYSRSTRTLAQTHPDYLASCIRQAEQMLKELKKALKETT